MAAEPTLQARALAVRRGGRAVVEDVSTAFPAGSWTALVGPNGAGKSTLLQALAGLLAPAEGQVQLFGRPLADWPARERARRLAWLAQQGPAQGELRARDVVALGRLPHHGLFGAPGPEDARIVDEALSATDSQALASRPLSALSGGERQRVLLARAFAVQAPVLLLDEPTTHLDAPHTLRLTRHLRQRAAAGDTVVTVLHDLTLALQADRVLVMADGQLRALGRPGDAPLHRALEQAFGYSVRVQAVGAPPHARWVVLVEPASASSSP